MRAYVVHAANLPQLFGVSEGEAPRYVCSLWKRARLFSIKARAAAVARGMVRRTGREWIVVQVEADARVVSRGRRVHHS